MPKASHARRRGDDYQAYYFWKRACQMLLPNSDIRKIGFEISGGYPVFDDVGVIYDHGKPWRDGLVQAEYVQIKYSVGYGKEITLESLLNPKFINAEKITLLQRLRDAVVAMQARGENAIFVLLSPWQIKGSDVLAKLYRREDGSLAMDRLFDGTTVRGEMGAVRNTLANHLELEDEAELRSILERLKIELACEDLQQIREDLCISLNGAGLRPFDPCSLTDDYSQLPWRLSQQGAQWFDAEAMQNVAERERIWLGRRDKPNGRVRLGIRTFMRWADGMEAESDHMLCLVHHFAGRQIHVQALWNGSVIPECQIFVRENVTRGARILLDVQGLSSVAFLTGYLIEPKLGADVCFLQRGEEWAVHPSLLKAVTKSWEVREFAINHQGDDIAVAISITHDVSPAVTDYIGRSVSSIRTVISFTPDTGTSQTAIENGSEAFALAESLAQAVRQARYEKSITGRTHVFLAGPNGFAFYLGQMSRTLGAMQLYEYNLDDPEANEYWASVALDPTVSI